MNERAKEIEQRTFDAGGNYMGIESLDAKILFDEIKRITGDRDYWQGYGEESLAIESKLRDETKRLAEENERLIREQIALGESIKRNGYTKLLQRHQNQLSERLNGGTG